jgi:hypothetical protein
MLSNACQTPRAGVFRAGMGKSCRLVERGSFFGKILMHVVARILDL